LTAALALLREGVDVDVYEQASEFQEVGRRRSDQTEHACCARLACRRRSSASPRSRGRRKSGSGARARAGSCSISARFPSSSIDFLRVHAAAGFTRHAGGGNPTPEARCLASRHAVRRRPVGDRRDASFPYRRDCAGRAGDRCRRRSFDCAGEPVRRCVNGSAENAQRFHNPSLADAAGAEAYATPRVAAGADHGALRRLFTYDATAVPI
jgi:hypothetical protein